MKIKNPKFFKEIPGNSHLDIRYGKKNLKSDEIKESLENLLSFYSDFCKKNNIKPIIMHGSLIGFYFNKKMLNWDDDIDIILTGKSINNMKNFETSDYLIEVNPYSKCRTITDIHNKIDARVIDKLTGCFIDITYFVDNICCKNKRCLYHNYICAKDKHFYNKTDIFPLKKDIFCNSEIYVPNNIKKCLVKEYGKKVFLNTYKNWVFKPELNDWIKN